MKGHLLDRPVWSALTTRQAEFGIGRALARRFSPEIGPLAAARDDSAESLEALAALIPQGGSLILLQAESIVLPHGVTALTRAEGVQLVTDRVVRHARPVDLPVVKLGESDWPAMYRLATLTQPGPFESETGKVGEFWGIKDAGRVVAMAGERMRQEGFTEVSGVCTHPDYRGRGYAAALSLEVTRRILARGENAYLHSYAVNQAAIHLYESLGFRVRCPMHVAVIARG
jgi:predicted GNAT family acetyltransferase